MSSPKTTLSEVKMTTKVSNIATRCICSEEASETGVNTSSVLKDTRTDHESNKTVQSGIVEHV